MYFIKAKAMVGKHLKEVLLSKDKRSLLFKFMDNTEQMALAEGDCCSYSWVEHLTIPCDVEGSIVIDVFDSGEIEPSSPVVEAEYESIAVYHTVVRTTKGYIVIEYRNSSNGYYGGWLEWNPIISI